MPVNGVEGTPYNSENTKTSATETHFANKIIKAQQDTIENLSESILHSDSRQHSSYKIRSVDVDKSNEDKPSVSSYDSGISMDTDDDELINLDKLNIASTPDNDSIGVKTRSIISDDSGRGSVDETSIVYEQNRQLTVIKRLGSGGNGVIDLVSSNKTQQHFALKTSLNNKDNNELLREAQLMKLVGYHPNIAEFYGLYLMGGKKGLLMEYIPGESLNVTLKKMTDDYLNHRISHSQFWGTFQYLLTGILLGLKYLEDKRISHQDIKPENIMVNNETLNPVIIDLGKAGVIGDVAQSGTEFYMPPEFFVNEGDSVVSDKRDAYSIGQMVYSLLSSVVSPGTMHFFVAGAKYDDLNSSSRIALLYRLHIAMKEYQKTDPDTGESKEALTPISSEDLQSRVEDAFKQPDQLDTPIKLAHEENLESRYMPLDQFFEDVLPKYVRKNIMIKHYATGYKSALIEFVNQALHPTPEKRLNAKQALQQSFIIDPQCSEEEAKQMLKQITKGLHDNIQD